MRHQRTRKRTAVAALAVLVLSLLACDRRPVSPHEALTAGAEPLRSHFNRDIGHARVVLLAAPT